MKKIFTCLLMTAMLIGTMGCGAKSESTTGAPNTETKKSTEAVSSKTTEGGGDKITIGFATKSSSSPFWVKNIEGANKAAKELGIELKVIGPPVENDVSGQISVLEDMITSKVNAIVVAPAGDVGVADVVKKAKDANIPVVCVDNGVQGVDVLSLVATDNYRAGELAAEAIGKEIGGKGKVIIVNGIVAQGSGKGRRDGFIDYMNKTYGKDVQVVEVTGDWDDQKALSGFEAALAANKDVKGTYAAWDGAALQIHKVLKQQGLSDVAICGFDCYDEALKLINSGDPNFRYDIAQDPSNMGYTAVKTAFDAIKGKQVEKNIDTGTKVVTKDNVKEYAKSAGAKLD